MNTQTLGQYGEESASKYLQDKGYKILDKNFRNKLGEIDLVAQQGNTICFIEVKTRKNAVYGAPFEAVHSTKQHKMVKVALSYLKYKFQRIDVPCRFDVISIYKISKDHPVVVHMVNAFDLSYLSH
jgi:putative endonuclease